MSTRRDFLRTSSFALVAAPLFGQANLSGASAPGSPVTGLPVTGLLEIGRDGTGPVVPQEFIGLSYENMQLEDAAFFSPANTGLVQQFRNLSPRGVLRLGGNTSEFGWWKAKPGQPAPARSESPWHATGEPTAATTFAITPEAVRNLDGFLRATGWSCIYGLNLGYGTPETDVPEAVFVAQTLGPRLQYFQVGNEVDLFRRHLRDPDTWNAQTYLDQWLVIARAVQKAVPGARFGMPDVAGDVSWLTDIAARWPTLTDRPNVVTLSHHYYWSGPPSNPDTNISNLLKTDPKVARDGHLSADAARAMGPGTTWRMTEGNTVYRGGKDGVSDVFASALWSASYLIELMQLGYCGVNLHGGSGHAQAVSVGGTFVGEALMPNPDLPHPKPFYTPIANVATLAGSGVNGRLGPDYVLEPVGYGMKFVGPLAGGKLLPLNFDTGGVNAVACAARKGKETLLAIVNRDLTQDLRLKLPHGRVVWTLEAPALTSREATLRSGGPAPATSGTTVIPAHSALLLSIPG